MRRACASDAVASHPSLHLRLHIRGTLTGNERKRPWPSNRYIGPAELTLRVSAATSLPCAVSTAGARHFGSASSSRSAQRRRARAAQRTRSGIARRRTRGGCPSFIDPEITSCRTVSTRPHLVRGPYSRAGALTPVDLMSATSQAKLVKSVVDYQSADGASAVIAPYVPCRQADPGWLEVQAGLWRRTAAHPRRGGLSTSPSSLSSAIGWRCLHPLRGRPGTRGTVDRARIPSRLTRSPLPLPGSHGRPAR